MNEILAHRVRSSALRHMRTALSSGAARYVRERHLPRLFPDGLGDDLVALGDGRTIINALSEAIRIEREGERVGHWSHDWPRLVGLHQARIAERRTLRAGAFEEAA